jgi:RNA polymerase sigma-70 factor (ECF subfamily)
MKTFQQIYAEYRDKIYNHITFRIRNSQQAEDLTQEVFIKVYKNLAMYDESKGLLSTWIYTIANNLVVDYFREKKLLTTDLSMYVTDDGGELDALSYHCTTETPHIVLMRKEIRTNVQVNISLLPKNIRRVAKLFFYANFNYNEIATALDIPLGTVKNSIFRAREILQASLKQEHAFME